MKHDYEKNMIFKKKKSQLQMSCFFVVIKSEICMSKLVVELNFCLTKNKNPSIEFTCVKVKD